MQGKEIAAVEIGGCRDYVRPMAQLEAWKYQNEKGLCMIWSMSTSSSSVSSRQRAGRRREALYDSD